MTPLLLSGLQSKICDLGPVTSLLLPAALLLDILFEEPPARFHPVCAMGALAQRAEALLRSITSDTRIGRNKNYAQLTEMSFHSDDPFKQRVAGFIAALLVLLPFSLGAAGITVLAAWMHPGAGFAIATLCIWLCMAPSSLARHALRTAKALENDRLSVAHMAVAMMVSRCTQGLDRAGTARACVESIAENLTDGVLATLFWAVVGDLLLGLPGASAFPVLHRVSNTLDAMWGKKVPRWRHFGSFAAHLDDMLNFIPARLALAWIPFACMQISGIDARNALKIGWTYRLAHESPNSAWSEAAFAGALHLKLGGPAHYPGGLISHPFIGTGSPHATPGHIRLAISILQTTTLDATVLLGVLVLFL